ncbi:DUF3784 domain-containing protein [Candidatus Pseudothioglobus singularis]|nr:DUF3784 domain-containing protein [Candidatus Pseudothioglobus singularis]
MVEISMIVPFIVLGIILYNGKGAFLIAGYNTLPKEEKEKYDEKALCRFVGISMFVLTLPMVLFIIADHIGGNWLYVLGTILLIGYLIFMLIYMNIPENVLRSSSLVHEIHWFFR